MTTWTLLLGAALLSADTAPENWPGFRGDGSSHSAAKHLPVSWSAKEGVAWKAALPGYGQSAPVVWGGHVYVTAVAGDEKEKFFLVAVDAGTGKTAWAKEFAASQTGKNTPMSSRAAPTPLADAAGVYAFFEGGDLVALTHAGEPRWGRSLVKEYGAFKNGHGLGGSPAQTADAVFVLIDHAGPSYLVAVDKTTGKNRWKADRPSKSSWTTPVVAAQNGKAVVLASSSGTLTAYDAATGKQCWEYAGLTGNNIVSPTVQDNLVVVGAGENRTTPDVAASAKSNCCLRLTETAAGYEVAWQGKKAVSHHASPLIHQGHAYFVTKTGVVYCVDLATGAERYAERLDNPCWASPVAAEDRIYFFGKDGTTTILKAGPKYEKVAANRLWSQEDFDARKEAEKKAVAAKDPPERKGRAGKGPGGGPPVPKGELEATRASAVGDVVYGAAAVEGAFYLRTGTDLYCVRDPKPVSRR